MATTATTISKRYSSEDDDDVILFRRLEDPCFVSRMRERAREKRGQPTTKVHGSIHPSDGQAAREHDALEKAPRVHLYHNDAQRGRPSLLFVL